VEADAAMSGPAAILDVDGTLVDSNYQHTIAWYRALRQHGQVLPVWRIHRHIGMGGDQLIASRCGDEVEQYLDLLDARGLADAWTTAGDVERTKPEPDLVHAALDHAGTDSVVMVGDSTWDCEAANRAGVQTVAVLTGGFSEQELRDAGAVAVFDSIEELRRRLSDTPLG
jgi:phosphoglycolate phosphatase-like HAD superfamily hydrolase